MRDLLIQSVWAGLGATGFAVLFNIQPRLLWACGVAAAIGFLTRDLVLLFTLIGPITATLIGATAVGSMAQYFARLLRAPAPLFAVCGVIPMVPGSFAYQALIGLVRVVTAEASPDAIAALGEATLALARAALIVAALALGIAMPTLLMHRHRPVV